MSKLLGPERPKPDSALLDEIDKVPLFMSNLPEEENDSLAALQSLLFDGPPEEIAENFKRQGNECFKEGRTKYQDAIVFYTKALETNCSDNKIIEACLANRAAVNLELGNFRKVLTDCAKVINLNSTNVKAFYRSAKALCELDKMEEALDCCDHGLKVEPNNVALRQLKETCIKKKELLDQRIRINKERERKERETKDALETALKARNIVMVTTNDAPTLPHSVHLNSENQLVWPVMFLYPEYKETDFIAEFNEENTFQDHLDVMFENPAPWDASHRYKPDNVQVYHEYILTTGNEVKPKLLKIANSCTLKEVLSHPRCVVKNGIPGFIILSGEGKFREDFLSSYK
ncbi:4871_t:CDS:2 [Acaulospora morrowiae]|uniref:4871_t:CDS:1 n=1 Tax=Acaulospora morrowiae TaxID=94023 RepID=A0A9N8Z623_9GLOM|nr:4871_t:CDS:2 [Acaulospora morrowiae]